MELNSEILQQLILQLGISSGFFIILLVIIKNNNQARERENQSKDDMINKLMIYIETLTNVNQDQNDQIKKWGGYTKEIAKQVKDISKYAYFGQRWCKNHIPSKEMCSSCTEYNDCPHPVKVRIQEKDLFVNKNKNNDNQKK